MSNQVNEARRSSLAIAVAQQTYSVYCNWLGCDRWRARASTSIKHLKASDVPYAGAPVAPRTIDTMPEGLLLVFTNQRRTNKTLPRDGGDPDQMMAAPRNARINTEELAGRLQGDGARAFADSQQDRLGAIVSTRPALSKGMIRV